MGNSPQDFREIIERLDALQRRLTELERWVGMPARRAPAQRLEPPAPLEQTPLESTQQESSPPFIPLAEPELVPPAVPTGQAPFTPPPPVSEISSEEWRAENKSPSRGNAGIDWANQKSLEEWRAKTKSPPQPRKAFDMETWIGQNWTSWVGGIVLLLGICFFLKYAWDHGWIRPSPQMRVMLVIGLGAAICASGEWVLRRKMPTLAVTLFGTGIAIVITAFFGANRYFRPEVLSRGGAFIGVAITAAAGIGLALRVNNVTVAILSFIGAFLCPYILRSHDDNSIELLVYHILIAATAWVLSFVKGARFAETEKPFGWMSLRWLALAGSFVWFFQWWMQVGQRGDYETLALAWIALIFFGFFAEILLTLQVAIPKLTSQTPFTEPPPDAALSLFSLTNTAVSFGAFFLVLKNDHQNVAIVACVLAAFAGAIAFVTASRALMWSALIQSVILITLAIPLWFDGYSITIAWLVLAVALASLGWLLNIEGARAWAIALLFFVVIRLVAFDSRSTLISSTITTLFGQPFTQWLVFAWTTAILFHLIAWMKPERGRWGAAANWLDETYAAKSWVQDKVASANRPVLNYATPPSPPASINDVDPAGIFLALVGTILFAGSSIWQWKADWLTLLGIFWLAPIFALARPGQRLAYVQHGFVLAAFIAAHWFVIDNCGPLLRAWSRPSLTTIPPLINLSVLTVTLLCAALAFATRQLREHSDDVRNSAYGAIGFLLFAAITFESWRTVDYLANHGAAFTDATMVKQMVMSVLWSIIGFTSVLIGFWKKIQLLRYAALGLLAITLTKVFIVDMKEVQAVWRILSFIALGSLLLGVSYLYNRYASRESASEQNIGT